jgi:16S rRNA processing protein RimM
MARRSNSTSTESDDVVVGVVRAPHGMKGEVRVEPLTDRFEERFRRGSKLLSTIGPVTVASVRGTAAQPIVAFEGIHDRTAAGRLRGDLRVARERREGEHLWVDLIGRRVVTPEGKALGTVTEILRAGGADVLVVGDLMLPMIESVIREIGDDQIVAIPQEEA